MESFPAISGSTELRLMGNDINLDKLAKLIDENSGDDVEFGDPKIDHTTVAKRLEETEDILGCELPPSYLWFVKNYCGGELYGEEFCSIYPVLSNHSIGDIAIKTNWNRERGFVGASDVVVCTNDFGEIFYMDTTSRNNRGEYPIYVKIGERKLKYADSFAEFLYKRISNTES